MNNAHFLMFKFASFHVSRNRMEPHLVPITYIFQTYWFIDYIFTNVIKTVYFLF